MGCMKRNGIVMAVIFFLLLLGSMQVIGGSDSECLPGNEDFYPYFSTRTVYDVVRGDVVRPKTNCKPVQIWMLARHGTRYPSKSEIKKIVKLVGTRDRIIENHENGAGLLCPSTLKKLTDWKLDSDLKSEIANKLAPQGKRDMYRLAQRLRKAFPELLQVDAQHVKPHDFIFRATDTQRTKSSLKSFAQGILKTKDKVVPPEEPPANDTLLMAYKNCPAWKSQYWEDHYDAESNKFAAGPEVQNMIEGITRRLGFNYTLDYDLVRTIYNLCRFETAWHPRSPSIWCNLFADSELKIFEYQEDLDHYYYCGPGRPWNAQLGCQPLKDMFTRFKEVVDGNSKNHTKGVFYFAHTVTLETLMAALGTDGGSLKPLVAAKYSTSQSRKYRTSLFGAFATNVIAVLSKCTGSASPYAVSFYTAEKLEKIKGCQAGLCDWDFIEREFAKNIENCSMNFC